VSITLDSIARDVRRQWGDRADVSGIAAAAHLLPYYGTGTRVRVVTDYGNGETYERTGTVSRTTGWRPALLLIHRSNAHGSSDLLSERDRVVAVKRGREYVTL
jgi:hypothetical protein